MPGARKSANTGKKKAKKSVEQSGELVILTGMSGRAKLGAEGV